MNNYEKEMLKIIIELKNKYNLIAIKAELEDEGSNLYDIIRLNNILRKANVSLYIKISGCGSINDLKLCKLLDVSGIIAPMIETPYAMRKYIDSINQIYSIDEQKDVDFICNIETINGFQNIKSIISANSDRKITYFTIGRKDMLKSLALSNDQINCRDIFNMCEYIVEEVKKQGYLVGLGGGVTAASDDTISFISNLNKLDRLESRKVIFNSLHSDIKYIENAVILATKLELLYLQNNELYYKSLSTQEQARYSSLQNYFAQKNMRY